MDKPVPFLGRDALAAQLARGLTKRLVLFTFDDPAVFPWGGEPILMNGRNVGELTSTGFSRGLGRAVAMGYARSDRVLTDDAVLSARYEIDIAGELHRVTARLKPE
jgi:4-methylaminobutanoate oxidase (formaldehyde-forming)